jgi:hypothetical protein
MSNPAPTPGDKKIGYINIIAMDALDVLLNITKIIRMLNPFLGFLS